MKLQNLIHIVIGIVCIGLLPGAKALSPAPDGGYPGGNTAVVASDISFSGQNRVPTPSPFAVGAATHETWADSQAALQFPNASEVAAEIETVSSAPATRSSFMASWETVPVPPATYWMFPRTIRSAITWRAITTWTLAT